jgi:hypothetical protein
MIPLRAVLTGDIVHSTGLPKELRAALPGILRGISASTESLFGNSVRHPIDIFRGDSWQLLVEDAPAALRIAIFVRASLRSAFETARMDTRIAIGIGTVDFVPEHEISGGDGEAFRLSGQALDEMGRGFRMALVLPDRLSLPFGRTLDAMAKLIDVQAASWTQRQAFAVSKALLGLTQEEIGTEWMESPISQQTVAQHLASAGWNAIEYALAATEAVRLTGP